jgi:hypothetical protein
MQSAVKLVNSKDDLSLSSSTTPLCIRWCMFLLLELEICTEYLLKMRLLAEVDAAGEAVEGVHTLMYPLVHVPVAGTRNLYGILTEYVPSGGSRHRREGSGRGTNPCVSAGACSCCWNKKSVRNTY